MATTAACLARRPDCQVLAREGAGTRIDGGKLLKRLRYLIE